MSNTHTILVIEDALELRGALTDQLSLYEEYEAAAAENGNQGIQVAKTERIDLVIMDVGWCRCLMAAKPRVSTPTTSTWLATLRA